MNYLYKTICLFLVFTFGCDTSKKNLSESKFEKLDKQFLLTNEISLRNGYSVLGASSYLVKIEEGTYLCTAKHLTRSSMGFNPSLNLETYSDSVLYWKAFPRTNEKSNDTVITENIIYYDEDLDDLILFSLKEIPNNIGVLNASFKKLTKGDRLRVLGCEYSDTECIQNEYFGTFVKYTIVDQIEMEFDSLNVSLSGFSGAPVLNTKNEVIGHVSGGGDFGDGILKVYVAPIELAKKALGIKVEENDTKNISTESLNEKERQIIESHSLTENLKELENLFNHYSDTNTVVSMEKSELSVFLKEQNPKAKTIINLNEISSLYYNYVPENPTWPHQVVLKCPELSQCMEVIKYYNGREDFKNQDTEVYMFSDKEASLKVLEIFKHLKKII